MVDGFVLRRGCIFVPSSSTFWPQLLATTHVTGHEGVQKMLRRFRASFYSPNADRWVRDYVYECATWQRYKTEHLHPAGLHQSLPVPTAVWQDIALDFVEGFPRVCGKLVVFTMVDRFSKCVHFIALGHPYLATSVLHVFFKQILRLHGIPRSIVSDRNLVFTSAFWTELFQLSSVELRLSLAFLYD